MAFPLISFFILFSCRDQEPVLVGIPPTPILSQAQSAKQKRSTPTPTVEVQHYKKPEAVIVDVQAFGGASFTEVQPYLAEQLGGFVSKHTLSPKDGERRVYERGEVRVVDDEIYMIRFTLPESMRRNKALQAAGFLEQIDEYIITHKEYKALHQYEFVRIRMLREDKETEMVTVFEAWKWLPVDRASR